MAEKSSSQPKVVRITLVKSPIGYTKTHKATIRALGLRRMHQTVEQEDTPALRGMLRMVAHLVEIEQDEQVKL